MENAEKKVRRILKEHHSEPLAKDVVKELEEIIQEAEKNCSRKTFSMHGFPSLAAQRT